MKKHLKNKRFKRHIQSNQIIAMVLCAYILSLSFLVCIEPIASGADGSDIFVEVTPTPEITEEPKVDRDPSTSPSHITVIPPTISPSVVPTPEPTPEPTPNPVEEYREAAIYIAKAIWGEARGCSAMERAAVVWCILNRVDEFYGECTPENVIKVVTARHQFAGYKKKHPVKDVHYDLAIDVIGRWLREHAGETEVGRVLPKEYLWFAGDGKHNHFRDSWKGGNRWDWSYDNPYKNGEFAV